MAQLFQEAQTDAACHRKNALAVRKHFKVRTADEVNADLVQCVNKVRAGTACACKDRSSGRAELNRRRKRVAG